ncbi:MAG: DUF3604 domain-containing protein [Burkholderiales bacterium]|nr:DUF3604 domain-containing protein [Burkholderiales bacterium]
MKTTPLRRACLLTLVGATAGLQPNARADGPPPRNAYFGETHLHTAWSFDAFIFGTRASPDEAYRYERGEAIKAPGGYQVQLRQPLDFAMVTDHAEYMGMVAMSQDPTTEIGKLPIAKELVVRNKDDMLRVYTTVVRSALRGKPIPGFDDPALVQNIWKQVAATADKYYQPGRFTTFAAYEWTSAPDNANLHRNIIFKDTKQIPLAPFTSLDSTDPQDLWNWLDGQRKAGHEVLAISHNGNISDGLMFPVEVDLKGRPIDAAYAEQRMRNEPLSEVAQVKGNSETHPSLSPDDEFADFEILGQLLGGATRVPKVHGSYIREAYRNGIAMQAKGGFNPYKFGLVGASDSHDAAPAYAEDNYFGSHGQADSTPALRMSPEKQGGFDLRQMSSAGLGGVWAEANTREAIFAAFQRKETWGTTGPRIQVRLFGGWNYAPALLDGAAWVQAAYAGGVPMGGDLPPMKNGAPRFVVWAQKDPNSANLDRIQIVKGWVKDGASHEHVYDVSWAGARRIDAKTGKLPAIENTVDIAKASYTNSVGATNLQTVWTDPDFDAGAHAFYYARVLEIPTPRWTTYDAKALGAAPPANVPATIQERAYTSPIWYTPVLAKVAAKKVAKPIAATVGGVTAAELSRRGATRLDDAAIRHLIQGKSLALANTANGLKSEIVYGVDGRSVTLTLDGQRTGIEEIGDVTNAGAPAAPSRYEIRDRRIVGSVAGRPAELAVYRLGGRIYLVHEQESGGPNWRVVSIE